MADTTIAPPLVDASSVSIARLHGEACWHCGTVDALRPTGEVTTEVEGGTRIWLVAACPEHHRQPLQPGSGQARMQSTRVGTRVDGLPIYAVHPVGTEPPALGPCLPECTRCPS